MFKLLKVKTFTKFNPGRQAASLVLQMAFSHQRWQNTFQKYVGNPCKFLIHTFALENIIIFMPTSKTQI